MTRAAPALALAISSLLVSGCFSTVHITRAPLGSSLKHDKSTKLKGIPFYAKKGVCKQETTWAQPVFTLIYTNTTISQPLGQAAKPIVESLSKTKVLSLSKFSDARVARLRAALSSSVQDVSKIDALWDQVITLEDYLPLPGKEDALIKDNTDVIQVSNTASPESVADYSRVFYYNVRRPWIGSSQVTVKLNADGTLTDASAQVESKTLSTILSFVPTKDLIGVATGGIKPANVESITHRLELSIKQENVRHTHTRYVKYEEFCKTAANGVTENYALKVEVPPSGSEKEEGGNTIEVTGRIKLPPAEKKDGKTP
jgi:hypothetical protein